MRLGRDGWLTSSTPTPPPARARRSASSRRRLDGGGLLISSSRLIEFNCRAAILIAPGLFRFDLTPQQETLGVAAAPARRPRPALGGRGGVVGRLPRAGQPRRAARAARGDRPPGRPAARLGARALVHRPRRRRGALRGQGRDQAPAGVSFDAAALLDWYERVRRPLPWRATRDPYALLVSEVMLQQTQAARVVPYYEAFLARFPDPAALAAAPAGRRARRLERPRLQPPRAGAPARRPRGRRARLARGPHRAAGRRRLHGRRRRLVRLGPPGRGRRHQRAPRDLPPRRRRARAARARRPRGGADAGGPGGAVQPGDDGARRDGLPAAPAATAAAARCGRAAPRRAARPRRRRRARRRERFEDTDRWARGRIVAALVAGEPPPALDAARRARAEAGLLRDGLAVRGADGALRLP